MRFVDIRGSSRVFEPIRLLVISQHYLSNMAPERNRAPSKKAQENMEHNGTPATPSRTPYARKANVTKKARDKRRKSPSEDERTPTPSGRELVIPCNVLLNAKWMWKNDKSSQFYNQDSGLRELDQFQFSDWWARCITDANDRARKLSRKFAQMDSAYAELRHGGSGTKKDQMKIKLEGPDNWEECRKILQGWDDAGYKNLLCNIDIHFECTTLEHYDGRVPVEPAAGTSARLVISYHSYANCRLRRKRTSSMH